MVAVAAAVPPPPPPPPPAATAAIAAEVTEAPAVAVAASNDSPRGKSVLNKFPCNEFLPTEKQW